MTTNYERMIETNLSTLFEDLPADLEARLGASKSGNGFSLQAFGEDAWFDHQQVTFSGKKDVTPRGASGLPLCHARKLGEIQVEPFTRRSRIFREACPITGLLAANSERVLIPHVNKILDKKNGYHVGFSWRVAEESGDFSMLLYPFPKIALCTIFYLADDEFPPSATCLFSRQTPLISCRWTVWPMWRNTHPEKSFKWSQNRNGSAHG
jgi:hypothetical protein